jgi:hypothetical protein
MQRAALYTTRIDGKVDKMKAGRNFCIAPGKGIEKVELLDEALGLRQGDDSSGWISSIPPARS